MARTPSTPDAAIERLNDYHGVVRVPEGAPRPALGEVVDRWPVLAKGRSG